MTDYIPLSVLNDFVFCPYSIYLHQVYMEADEDVYKAAPQTRGTVAPAVIFYNVYECGSTDAETAVKDVDTSAAGARVVIAVVDVGDDGYVSQMFVLHT